MLLSQDYGKKNLYDVSAVNGLTELKHENLSSILGTENEIFSLDDIHAPPTFREQKERTGQFFLTEKQTFERREDCEDILF